MRKGDEKKAEILQTAERLFCTRGYDATSIQDLLDVLHMSKGGFYHHFLSKDAVLKTLCEQRAVKQAERCAAEMNTVVDPLDRINTLLCQAIPLQREELTFISMLLPTLERADSVPVRVAYQDAITDAFRAPLEAELAKAAAAGVIAPVVKEVADPVLLLLGRCWLEAALYLLDCVKTAQRYEPAALLSTLEWSRRCIEVLLDAPYGSIVLIRLEDWNAFADQLVRRVHLA